MKTSGFKDYRLNKDDEYHSKEIKALEIFNDEYLDFASSIVFGINDGNFPNEYLNDREEKIVLSVIQWLGTPVGQTFISRIK